jgi:hypothetical protein
MIERNTIFFNVFMCRALWVGMGLGFVPYIGGEGKDVMGQREGFVFG